jgi:hypothetical protein
MSEMEQEKIVSLNADKSIRRALDIQEAKDLLNYHCEDDEAMNVLEKLDNDTLIKMYELVFGNPISNYIDMERGQMIEEITDEITNN